MPDGEWVNPADRFIQIDHDLLIRIDERVAELVKWAKNHDARHQRVESRLVAAVVSAATALAITVLGFFLGRV